MRNLMSFYIMLCVLFSGCAIEQWHHDRISQSYYDEHPEELEEVMTFDSEEELNEFIESGGLERNR